MQKLQLGLPGVLASQNPFCNIHCAHYAHRKANHASRSIFVNLVPRSTSRSPSWESIHIHPDPFSSLSIDVKKWTHVGQMSNLRKSHTDSQFRRILPPMHHDWCQMLCFCPNYGQCLISTHCLQIGTWIKLGTLPTLMHRTPASLNQLHNILHQRAILHHICRFHQGL